MDGEVMDVVRCDIPGLLLIEPQVFRDGRGHFLEWFQQERYQKAGLQSQFVQDNYSHSVQGTLRGLHYQLDYPQGKLVWTVRGEVYDVVLDLRRQSPTFGRWRGIVLSEKNHRQIYIPPGMAHGFCVMSETADVIYKCTDRYAPEHERTIRWNDPQLAIDWPVKSPLVSEKDSRGLLFADAPNYESLP